MDYQEIVFFERLGFGWVVDPGVLAKVFPHRAGRGKTGEEPGRQLPERRKPISS